MVEWSEAVPERVDKGMNEVLHLSVMADVDASLPVILCGVLEPVVQLCKSACHFETELSDLRGARG